MTEKFLKNPELISFLPPDRVILEVLEDLQLSGELFAGAQYLVQAGYTLALDDFVYTPEQKPLLKLAKLIKYDFSQTPAEPLAERIAIDHQAGRKVLVERIETAEEYDTLHKLGVDYFQGYFFAKPTTLTSTGIPSNRVAVVQLFALVNNPETSLEQVVKVLSKDVGLVVKTLRYVNSAGSGCRVQIRSIQQAAALLGRNTLRNWVNVIAMAGLDDKPLQLVNMALYRAKFCELMAEQNKLPDADSCFTLGMLSLLDVMTDTKLEHVLEKITISDKIKSALLGDDSEMSQLLKLAIELEQYSAQDSDSEKTVSLAAQDCFHQAIAWAEESVSMADC